MSSRRIAIIGAGVSGLTCGVVLQERGHDVEIFTEKEPMQTTSAVAAAIWFPYHAGDGIDGWAQRSYRRFESLVDERDSGVSMIDFRVFSRTDLPLPDWEVPRPRRIRDGYVVNVPVMETPIYLPYLMKRNRIRLGKINHLADVDSDVIVNCCGLDGPRLSHNETSIVKPGRGVVVYGQSTLDYAFLDADIDEKDGALTYIVPRKQNGDCVFGGSDDPQSNWSTEASEGEVQAIVERCKKIDPGLITSEPKVGLRPLREKGVRLEREMIDGRTVIHNYGHGGAGLTLSWGCAEEVANLVKIS